MTPLIKKLLIGFGIILVIIIGYMYFSGSSAPSSAAPAPLTSGLVPTGTMPGVLPTGPTVLLGGAVNNQISQDTSFLGTLASLTRIKIDPSLFSSSSFNALNDNTVQIVSDGISGRPNPFAPFDQISANPLVPPVITSPATGITSKEAFLNGSIAGAGAVTSIYFEYGTTNTLGKTTASVTQSLIGTFSKQLTGLTPKTTYYYRAAAKTSAGTLYGETLSFITSS